MLQFRSATPTAALLLVMVVATIFSAHPSNAQSPSSTCFANPTQPSCASFTISEQDIETNIVGLCKDMPYMVGCSLWNSCQNNAADGLYCQPMAIYGTICEEMGEMTDCTSYYQLCFTPGSVVEQCTSPGPLPAALSTAQTVQAVLDMCSSHSMVGCEDCTGRSTCPTPLETLGKLCHSMPGMAQCAGFFNMCSNSAVESTFHTICDEDDKNDPNTLPPMKMWMHAGTYDILLLKEWIPQNTGQYVGYCFMCIVAAIVVQGLKAWRVRLEARWASEYRIACCETAACGTAPRRGIDVDVDDDDDDVCKKGSGSAASSEEERSSTSGAELSASTSSNSRRGNAVAASGTCCSGHTDAEGIDATTTATTTTTANDIIVSGGSGSGQTNNLRRRRKNKNKNPLDGEIAVGGRLFSSMKWQFIIPSNEQMLRNIIRGLFTFIIVFLDYMLMLLVMSFNIGIIFSTVAGFAFGAVLFGHWGERVGSGSAVAVGELAPDSENDLEVHFMEAQTCCNARHV